MPTRSRRRLPVVTVPLTLWLVAFFVIPLVLLGQISFYGFDPMRGVIRSFTMKNYAKVFLDTYFLEIFWRTFRISVVVTVLSVVLGYPEAYLLSRLRGRAQTYLMLLLLSPLIVSTVIRTFGWLILLGPNGPLNRVLVALGVVEVPLRLLFTETAVIIGLTHVLVPLMILSIYSALANADPLYERAAQSLGAPPWRTFLAVTWPLSLPGVLAGSLIVFTLSMSAFVTPAVLGGRRVAVMAFVTYDEFLYMLNWPFGSAVSVILMAITGLIVLGYNRWIEHGTFAEIFR